MINRAAIILKYKSPAVQWINEADPYNADPGISLESVNEDRKVYLIKDEDATGLEAIEQWIKMNYEALFENELKGWYTDENLWPKKRDLRLFREWFDVDYHSVIEDTVGLPIEDDEP
jgi:hypothetical protein